jgi:hypothetical protein
MSNCKWAGNWVVGGAGDKGFSALIIINFYLSGYKVSCKIPKIWVLSGIIFMKQANTRCEYCIIIRNYQENIRQKRGAGWIFPVYTYLILIT